MGRELSTPSPARPLYVLSLSFRPSRHPVFTPVSFPLFSCTYELPNFQALCFQILTTVGVGGTPASRKMRKVMTTLSPDVKFLLPEIHNREAAPAGAADTSADALRCQ